MVVSCYIRIYDLFQLDPSQKSLKHQQKRIWPRKSQKIGDVIGKNGYTSGESDWMNSLVVENVMFSQSMGEFYESQMDWLCIWITGACGGHQQQFLLVAWAVMAVGRWNQLNWFHGSLFFWGSESPFVVGQALWIQRLSDKELNLPK